MVTVPLIIAPLGPRHYFQRVIYTSFKNPSIIIEDEQSESNPVTHMSPRRRTPPDTLYLNLRHGGGIKPHFAAVSRFMPFHELILIPRGTTAAPTPPPT